MQFIKLSDNTNYDKNPFVLIDISGSTLSRCNITDSTQNILNAEMNIIHKILTERKIDCCNLILWSDKVKDMKNVKIDILHNNIAEPDGGTALNPALREVLRYKSVSSLKNRDIYIVTDGEIFDANLIGKSFADLFAENINIYIITVESGSNNYYTKNCYAGNKLYSYLNENSKMNFVKEIIQYNNYHKEGFAALNNFDVPTGYLPFRNDLFLASDFKDFLKFLKEEIDKNNDDDILLKLAHDLSRTIFYLTKDKESNIRQIAVENVTEYFKNTNIYNKVRALMLKEIDNHVNHKSSTFQDYRSQRNELFERSQLDLMENTKKSITNVSTDHYISFPLNTNRGVCIFRTNDCFVNNNINMGKLKFNKSGLKLNNSTVPMFPCNIVMNEDSNQCLRQWVRANYSRVHNCKIISSKILCLVLIDMLLVNLYCNDVNIKNDYIKLAYVMLDAKTYGTNTTILQELLNKNQLPGYNHFENYLLGNKIDLLPGCLWLGILKYLSNDDLLISQQHIYESDISKYDIDNLMDTLRSKLNTNINLIEIKQKYILPKHEILPGIHCTNNYIEPTNFDLHSEYNKCDLCKSLIRTSDIIINEQENISDIELLDSIYKNNTCHDVKLELDNSRDLLKINDLDFNLDSYNIKNVVLTDVLNTSKLTVKTREEFIEKVYYKYPFMKDLDMTNVCLAGGFVRSILLSQRMKDFDFFIYGSEDPVKRMTKLMGDLIDNIKNTDANSNKCKFLYIYKPMFNVFEIVYVEDPTNHFDENFTAENFSKYKYDSLRIYDKKNMVPRDKNYFEDGDEKGIKIKHRFQFIMCKYDSIESIFNEFDMTPSCVAFDGKEVYLTRESYMAYKYMVNIVKNNTWTFLYDSRMSKYLSYGFDIAFPEEDIKDIEAFKNKFDVQDSVQLCSLKFDINKIIDNKIIIKHDSHKKELYETLNEIEKNNQDEGITGLYKSSLFCSLVSMLRYICINNMLYKFSGDKIISDENNIFTFRNGSHQLSFTEEFIVKPQNNVWYYDHYYIPPKTYLPENINSDTSSDSNNSDEPDSSDEESDESYDSN